MSCGHDVHVHVYVCMLYINLVLLLNIIIIIITIIHIIQNGACMQTSVEVKRNRMHNHCLLVKAV